MSTTVHRNPQRMRTTRPGIESRYSFSFGEHYDPGNTHFGLLLANNEETLRAGHGFDTHPHRDTEIVTWVLEGSLVHQDSAGHCGVISPGIAQRLSAGSGIEHSERNDAWRIGGPRHDEPVRMVQMWVAPDTNGARPSYEQMDIGRELDRGGLVVVASGMRQHRDDRAVAIQQRDAACHAARLPATRDATLPEQPYVHVFVARGTVQFEAGPELADGDAARITEAGGQRMTAGSEGAEVLVWEMSRSLSDGR